MKTNIVICWRIKLTNGKLLCFTDADEDLLFEGELYHSGSYFTPNSIIRSNELAQDNFSINGIIDNNFISEKFLMDGGFANSYLEVFLVDIESLTKTILKTGWIGGIKYSKKNFTAEIHSLADKTKNLIGKCYSASCRAEFGDQFCKINKENYTVSGKITKLAETNNFIDESLQEPDDYFSNGMLVFTSGINKDCKYTVREFRENKISLDSILAIKMQIGDQYQIIAGCNKMIDTCVEKFNNVINFRGEPFIPSQHKIIAYN